MAYRPPVPTRVICFIGRCWLQWIRWKHNL